MAARDQSDPQLKIGEAAASAKADREVKLAQALRANLRRRKIAAPPKDDKRS